MGGAAGYLYLSCLCGAAVLCLFGLGAVLTWWGRRRERKGSVSDVRSVDGG